MTHGSDKLLLLFIRISIIAFTVLGAVSIFKYFQQQTVGLVISESSLSEVTSRHSNFFSTMEHFSPNYLRPLPQTHTKQFPSLLANSFEKRNLHVNSKVKLKVLNKRIRRSKYTHPYMARVGGDRYLTRLMRSYQKSGNRKNLPMELACYKSTLTDKFVRIHPDGKIDSNGNCCSANDHTLLRLEFLPNGRFTVYSDQSRQYLCFRYSKQRRSLRLKGLIMPHRRARKRCLFQEHWKQHTGVIVLNLWSEARKSNSIGTKIGKVGFSQSGKVKDGFFYRTAQSDLFSMFVKESIHGNYDKEFHKWNGNIKTSSDCTVRNAVDGIEGSGESETKEFLPFNSDNEDFLERDIEEISSTDQINNVNLPNKKRNGDNYFISQMPLSDYKFFRRVRRSSNSLRHTYIKSQHQSFT